MKIVADRDIYQVEKYFSAYGDLVLLPGREITPEYVKDADALLVRTITRINESLLKGSRLRFVGSAASGTDHVESDCLKANEITFAHAPGCNADAVVDYVFAALAWLSRQEKSSWRDQSIGIIGAGNVGSRLAKKMLALGLEVNIHDPLLPSSHSLSNYFVSQDDVLACRIISLHVPLTSQGEFSTRHLLNTQRLSQLGEGSVLINACRGEVIDNKALLAVITNRPDLRVVMDVWENEPGINQALAELVDIATPHIAGYSRNGKRNATRAVLRAFCDFLGLESPVIEQEARAGHLELPGNADHNVLVDAAILQAYPINNDVLDLQAADLAAHFDQRRNNYAFRAECRDFDFTPDGLANNLVRDLETLEFRRQ